MNTRDLGRRRKQERPRKAKGERAKNEMAVGLGKKRWAGIDAETRSEWMRRLAFIRWGTKNI